MNNRTLIVVMLLICGGTANAQEVVFGSNNYIEYQAGTLPVVISVPHGGDLEPASIPDRTCNNPVYATDANTIETALAIKSAFYTLTGCYPHLIICHLKRNKLDCNRNLANGACGNTEAGTAWSEFQNFITEARHSANQQYDQHTFFVDLHGHGNPIQRIELGYLLYDNELELSDSVLNTSQYLGFSSIKNLALDNLNNYTHAQLLKGPYAFGSLLEHYNYPSVPSQNIPYPGTATNYFSGGYITANHTCYAPGVAINGLQMELNFNGIRDSESNRSVFADAFAQSVVEFIGTHFDIQWNSCAPVNSTESIPANKLLLYPNPAAPGETVCVAKGPGISSRYEIFDVSGRLVSQGWLDATNKSISTSLLPCGVFVILLTDALTGEESQCALVVE